MAQRIAGITIWILQAIWYTNDPNPSAAAGFAQLALFVIGLALIFAPRGSALER